MSTFATGAKPWGPAANGLLRALAQLRDLQERSERNPQGRSTVDLPGAAARDVPDKGGVVICATGTLGHFGVGRPACESPARDEPPHDFRGRSHERLAWPRRISVLRWRRREEVYFVRVCNQWRGIVRLLKIAIATVLVAIVLAGCTPVPDVPTIDVSGVPSSSAAVGVSAPVPSAHVTMPPAEAQRMLARFDTANRGTVQRLKNPGGRAFIDGLVAAGFRRSGMQVTEDSTTIGLAVPSVQFSVLVGGVCLIGQNGPNSSGYRGIVAEPVDGTCLLGRTRAIDW